MAELQWQYRQRVEAVLALKAQRRVKVLLLQALTQQMRSICSWQDQCLNDLPKGRKNYEVLSTAVSECPSNGEQMDREVEELEQRIVHLQTIKFEQNEHIQALEEELDEKQRTVMAQSEYNDQLKHRMLRVMQTIEAPKEKEKSVLNKSIDAVAGILTFRWW